MKEPCVSRFFCHSMWWLRRFKVRQDSRRGTTAGWVWGCSGLEPGTLLQIQGHPSFPTPALFSNQQR